MSIDTINHSYVVTITDSIILAENISTDNLVQILSNIDELNAKVKESILKGEVTTLYLITKDKFKSFTIGESQSLAFKDERGTEGMLSPPEVIQSSPFMLVTGKSQVQVLMRQLKLLVMLLLVIAEVIGRHLLRVVQELLLMEMYIRIMAPALHMEKLIDIGG